MRKYRVKGCLQEYIEILKEKKDGFDIKITKINEDYKEEKKEFISKSLFEACLRTNYLVEEEALSA